MPWLKVHSWSQYATHPLMHKISSLPEHMCPTTDAVHGFALTQHRPAKEAACSLPDTVAVCMTVATVREWLLEVHGSITTCSA